MLLLEPLCPGTWNRPFNNDLVLRFQCFNHTVTYTVKFILVKLRKPETELGIRTPNTTKGGHFSVPILLVTSEEYLWSFIVWKQFSNNIP
jgi:hypothetical protein